MNAPIKNIADFTKRASGVVEVDVVEPADISKMLAENDPRAPGLVFAISKWLRRTPQPQGKGQLCATCDFEFRRKKQPRAFVVVTPFADKSCALVTGICPACAAREGIYDRVVAWLRTTWPGLQQFNPGGVQ